MKLRIQRHFEKPLQIPSKEFALYDLANGFPVAKDHNFSAIFDRTVAASAKFFFKCAAANDPLDIAQAPAALDGKEVLHPIGKWEIW